MLPYLVGEYTIGKIDRPINFPLQQEWYSRTRNLYGRPITIIVVCRRENLTKPTNDLCSVPSWINIRNKAEDIWHSPYHIDSVFAAWVSKKSFAKVAGKDPFCESIDLRTVFKITAPMIALVHPWLSNKHQIHKNRLREMEDALGLTHRENSLSWRYRQ